jgi:hypothetical protein
MRRWAVGGSVTSRVGCGWDAHTTIRAESSSALASSPNRADAAAQASSTRRRNSAVPNGSGWRSRTVSIRPTITMPAHPDRSPEPHARQTGTRPDPGQAYARPVTAHPNTAANVTAVHRQALHPPATGDPASTGCVALRDRTSRPGGRALPPLRVIRDSPAIRNRGVKISLDARPASTAHADERMLGE